MDLGIGPLAALKILKSVRLIRFPISVGMVSLSVPEPLVILRDWSLVSLVTEFGIVPCSLPVMDRLINSLRLPISSGIEPSFVFVLYELICYPITRPLSVVIPVRFLESDKSHSKLLMDLLIETKASESVLFRGTWPG